MTVDVYEPAAGLTLAVSGAPQARRHFALEYGQARVEPDGRAVAVHVDVAFASRLPHTGVHGGHKTVRWSLAVDAAGDGRPMTARLVLAGRPRRFALSLVQGFVVEPLVSLAAAHGGAVLLPAAALVEDGGAVVVLGRSRSGKTSVVAGAVAAGRGAFGDDQVLIDAAGQLRPWPRRLRVYPDLSSTAPAAVAALPTRRRVALRCLGALATLSGGWVAPSLPLAWTDLGAAAACGPAPVRRVVVLERSGSGPEVAASTVTTEGVVELARVVLREQRARLAAALGPDWRGELAAAEDREATTLRAALASAPAELWQVPADWPAPRAVHALSSRLAGGSPAA